MRGFKATMDAMEQTLIRMQTEAQARQAETQMLRDQLRDQQDQLRDQLQKEAQARQADTQVLRDQLRTEAQARQADSQAIQLTTISNQHKRPPSPTATAEVSPKRPRTDGQEEKDQVEERCTTPPDATYLTQALFRLLDDDSPLAGYVQLLPRANL